MRFRFCGDQDCPDWLLAEIILITKLSSVKMKLVCNTVVKNMLGAPLDHEKMAKLCKDAKYNPSDMEVVVACVTFIVGNATRFDVDSETLSSELQQLGLPKEHSQALCKSFGASAAALKTHFESKTLRLFPVEEHDWKVDYVLGTSRIAEVGQPVLGLHVKVSPTEGKPGAAEIVTASVNRDTLNTLVKELSEAHELMVKLESS